MLEHYGREGEKKLRWRDQEGERRQPTVGTSLRLTPAGCGPAYASTLDGDAG
jgi:hypothetical protein